MLFLLRTFIQINSGDAFLVLHLQTNKITTSHNFSRLEFYLSRDNPWPHTILSVDKISFSTSLLKNIAYHKQLKWQRKNIWTLSCFYHFKKKFVHDRSQILGMFRSSCVGYFSFTSESQNTNVSLFMSSYRQRLVGVVSHLRFSVQKVRRGFSRRKTKVRAGRSCNPSYFKTLTTNINKTKQTVFTHIK